MRRSPFRLLPLAAALACAAAAQQEVRTSAGPYRPPPVVLHAESSEVAVDVVVRQPDGAIVDGLAASDFRLLDNGRPRALDGFSVSHSAAPVPSEYAGRAVPDPGAPPAAAPRAAAPARSVAFYFDDVNTDKGDLAHARIAAMRFVHTAAGGHDRFAVYTASGVQNLAFTADHARVESEIGRIRTHPRQDDSLLGCPRITPYSAFLIAVQHDAQALNAAIFDAQSCPGGTPIDEFSGKPLTELSSNVAVTEPILAQAEGTWDHAEGVYSETLRAVRAAVDGLAAQPRPRLLLLASGGFFGLGGKLMEDQDNLVQDALHGDVVIDALDAKGLYTDGPGRPIDEMDRGSLPLTTFIYEEATKFSVRQEEEAPMVLLARSTGGLYFHDNNDLTLGFSRLGMVPSTTYHLAFSAADVPRDGKYHKLKVELAPRGKAMAQYRPGYFAPAPAAAAPVGERMDDALRTAAGADGLHAAFEATPLPDGVRVNFHLSDVPFDAARGRHNQTVRFVAALYTPQGAFVAGEQGAMVLALSDATWRKFAAQGFGAALALKAPPGDYDLRVAAGASVGGALFAAHQPVSVAH